MFPQSLFCFYHAFGPFSIRIFSLELRRVRTFTAGLLIREGSPRSLAHVEHDMFDMQHDVTCLLV